jgi:nucleoside-diphosphate-sugar epimerase
MTKKIKRIFITGATGFIGNHLTKSLISDGYELGILLRSGSETSPLSETIDKISIYRGDVRDGEGISRIFREFKPDAVFHLVTYYAVEHVPQDIGAMIDTNVKGTVNLLDAARVHGVKLFVNTSTCAVYEQQKDRPLTETDTVRPQNLYAVTKLQAEEVCKFYAYNYGVNGITLRLFPPYGPSDHERRLIPYVIKCFVGGQSPALTTGLQTWDFVYVDDVIDAYRAVLNTYPFKTPYDVINIGTGQPVSIRDVVLTIKRMTGSDIELCWGAVPHRKNEVWFNSADIRKANLVLGWTPKISLNDGIKKMVEGIQKRDN